jgi:hypothetical protein
MGLSTHDAALRITKGVAGTYLYHVAEPGKHTALCHVRVMATSIPLSSWGAKSHLNERWAPYAARSADSPSQAQEAR